MKINTHSLKIKGLKKASGETVNQTRPFGGYTEVFYNRSNGNVWAKCQFDKNTWTKYHNTDIIKVCNTEHHMTMQQIADAIAEAVTAREEEKMIEKRIEKRAREIMADPTYVMEWSGKRPSYNEALYIAAGEM